MTAVRTGGDLWVIPARTAPTQDGQVHGSRLEVVVLPVRLIRISPRSLEPDEHRHPEKRARGQSLVEFSLVLTPLMLVFLGLMQFGLVFSGYITLTNSVREAARTGTIYAYDRTLSKDQNDTARNNGIRTALLASFNQLSKTAPNFTSTGWTKSGLTWTSTDMSVAYEIPAGIIDSDPRAGQRITVRATYHLTLIIPFVGRLLTKDSGGRLQLSSDSTMVLN
jgi:Flp pilus assembly protein TadG